MFTKVYGVQVASIKHVLCENVETNIIETKRKKAYVCGGVWYIYVTYNINIRCNNIKRKDRLTDTFCFVTFLSFILCCIIFHPVLIEQNIFFFFFSSFVCNSVPIGSFRIFILEKFFDIFSLSLSLQHLHHFHSSYNFFLLIKCIYIPWKLTQDGCFVILQWVPVSATLSSLM